MNQAAPITLREINLKLSTFQLPVIPPEKMQDVLAHAKRDILVRAVNNLSNPAALEYTRKALRDANLLQEECADDLEAGEPNTDDQALKVGEGSAGNERAKFHVYGSRAALCFEEDTTRGGIPTIALDAATAVSAKTYDWGKKVRIQMTRAELPVVTSVLLGIRQSCEFKSHGQEKTKGFSMERQAGGKIFVKVFDKGQSVKAVPIEAPDVFYVSSLFMLQIRRNSPWIDAGSMMTLIRATMHQAG